MGIKHKYKVGDVVMIVKDTSSHSYRNGEIVKVLELKGASIAYYLCLGMIGERYVKESDTAPATPMAKIIYGE